MLRRLASTFSTPAATPDRSTSPETPAVDPNTHAGRTAVEHDLAHALRAHGVPTTDEDCFACNAACQDDGPQYDDYPRGFDVDWSSELLGSANPAPRNLVVSTARSDWAHDHTTDTSTLSYHLQTILNAERGFPPPGTPIDPPPAKDKSAKEAPKPAPEPVKDDKPPGQIDLVIGKNGLPQGLSETPRAELEPSSIDAKQPPTSLFSSSLISQSPDEDKESVLIFPEWKVICEVPNSSSGAKDVLAGLNGQANELKSWTLPYRAVVLLCSHKKRDKRCHIAAPLLEKALVHELESHHVSIDTRGDSLNPHHLLDMHAALPREGEAGEREARLRAIEGLDDETGSGEVGIFKISHLGGHRYSGVMIILFPSGATLYYGRVSPKDIPQVVKHTILKGQVIAGLLRGGNNVVRDELKGDSAGACNKKGKSLMTW